LSFGNPLRLLNPSCERRSRCFLIADAKVRLYFKPPNFSRKVFLFILNRLTNKDKKKKPAFFLYRGFIFT
ncbi:MAG: hypothetical protein RR608_12375, partial [Bacteroidales bacterium]